MVFLSSFNGRCLSRLLVVVALIVLIPAGAQAQSPFEPGAQKVSREPGYIDRGCGFDLDDDGLIGERNDDCRVCDGKTADPDGDGVAEDLIYVDCDRGRDRAGCGGANQPCLTLEFAWQQADGPTDGAEDIVCFKGTCSPDRLMPTTGGVPGERTRPASDSEARPFLYPRNPAMLVGWDSDGDGVYPPVDLDDKAVLDGAPGAKSIALSLNDGWNNSYFEIAHFTASDYNRYSQDPAGSFLLANRDREASHIYLHDLHLLGIGKDQQGVSGNITFNFFRSAGLRYFALENILARDIGGYFARGSGGDGENGGAGPFRFQGIDVTAHGCDKPCNNESWFQGFKLWGYVTGLEVIDSVFDCNMDAWDPAQCGAVNVAQCAQNVAIRNNRFVDNRNPIMIQGASKGFCDGDSARPVDDITIEENWGHNSHPWPNAVEMVSIRGGSGAATNRETVANVTIRNNFFSTLNAGYSGCLSYFGGNNGGPNPGTIRFLNNTCWGTTSGSSVSAIRLIKSMPFVHQSFEISNNVFQGLGQSDFNVRADYAPSDWKASSNSYDPTPRSFKWDGKDMSFDSWLTRTKSDAGSNLCRAALEDPSSGDLRLRLTDTCAQDRGLALEPSGKDFQGDPREGAWDRGADEVTIDNRPSISLLDGRFRVAIQYDSGKALGSATPKPLTNDSAYFSFLNPANVEALIKVIDGCAVNDHLWVFGAGLTNVSTGVRIEDSTTGEFWSYVNPAGSPFPPLQDIEAFSSCP